MEPIYSILLLTCDAYKDVAKKNLDLLNVFLEDKNAKIYVSSETTVFPGNVINLCFDEKTWSSRLIKSLNEIEDEIVLIILDDMWAEKKINGNLIGKYALKIKNNPQIANIAFSAMPGPTNKKTIIDCSIRNKKPWSLVNFQVGLWRKTDLVKFLDPKENPWDAEVLGSIRTRLDKKAEFYCLTDDKYSPYTYGKGWLIVRGKWNIKEVERLESIYSFKIDLGNRGCEDFSKGIPLSFFARVKIHLKVWFYKIKIMLKGFF